MPEKISVASSKALAHIDKVYTALNELPTMPITSYGPRCADESYPEIRRIQTTGRQLKRASSNSKQGRWLANLAEASDTGNSNPTCIVEIGTCLGISGMYLLAGMARNNGGHLITFEGSPELAKIAEANFNGLLKELSSEDLTFEIVQGPLEETFTESISKLDSSINLAFVDGNHQEEATIEYHNALKLKMSRAGVIIHDDIAWGEGMARAWDEIKRIESDHSIEELLLGWRPSRGIIRLGEASTGKIKTHHIDGIFERVARAIKNKLS